MPPRPQLSLPTPGSRRVIVLGQGVPAKEIPSRIGQAVEAPVTTAPHGLISGELPLEE